MMPNYTRFKKPSLHSLLPPRHVPPSLFVLTTRPPLTRSNSTNQTTSTHGEPSRLSTTSSAWAGMSPPYGAPPTATYAAMREPTPLPRQERLLLSRAASHSPPRPGCWRRHGQLSSHAGRQNFPSPTPHSNSLAIYTESTGQTPEECGGCFVTDRLRTRHPTSQQTRVLADSTYLPHTTSYVTVRYYRSSERNFSNPQPAISTHRASLRHPRMPRLSVASAAQLA